MYEAEREDGEVFNDFAERVGQTRFEDEVRDLSMPVEFSLDNMQYFIDWQRKEPFQVIRGEGECAV
jgi:sulfite reductase (ferredoxin)